MGSRLATWMFCSSLASACASDESVPSSPDQCVGLADLERPPEGVAAADWDAVLARIHERLQRVDDRHEALDLRFYTGRAHARDNSPGSGWPANEFDAESVALLEHLLPGGELEREVWTLSVFDVEEELFVELQQIPSEPTLTYVLGVSAFRVSGGTPATCSDCLPRLGDLWGSDLPVILDASFTGTFATGGAQIVDVTLELEPADETELGLLPLWLSNYHHKDKRGDEVTELDVVDGEAVLGGGLITEPFPVPAGVPYDACERAVRYSGTVYISDDCPERYGARDLQLEPPTVCCWYECWDCPTTYCLDPSEYED